MRKQRARSAVLATAFLGLLGAGCPPGSVETIGESFMLAFFMHGREQVHVSWSGNGTVWQDGLFPQLFVRGGSGLDGVAAASDALGALRMVSLSGTNSMQFIWGLGAAVWDHRADTNLLWSPESAPAIAGLGSNTWTVAYRKSGSIQIRTYDSSQQLFGPDLAPPHPLNTNVVGRPAIARMGTRTVVVFRRGGSGANDLYSTVGLVTTTGFLFNDPSRVPLDLSAELLAGVTNDPALTHDGTRFLLTAPREERSTGVLHGWQAPIVSSTDGVSWSPFLSTIGHAVRNDSILGLAGHTDGTLVAVELQKNSSGIGPAVATVSRRSGGTWSILSSANVLGAQPTYRQFSLIAAGRPNP